MQVTTFGFEDPCPDRIVFPCQTHSSKVTEIVTGLEDLSECDGVWTRRDSKNLEIQNFALGIKTADCAPIAFWDEEKYGIIHCGWRGLVGGIVEEALEIFNPPRSPFIKGEEQRTEESSLNIFVGPMLPSFEIQKDHCYDAIYDKFGDEFFSSSLNKQTGESITLFNFHMALGSLLPSQTQWDGRSTFDNKNLASWRRDNDKRRNVMVISKD